MSALTNDQIEQKMMALCALQAQVDEIKNELKAYLSPGETFGCPLGKLTLSKPSTTFRILDRYKEEQQIWRDKAVAKGWGSYSATSPSLTLTLNKEAKIKVPFKGTAPAASNNAVVELIAKTENIKSS